MNNRIYLRALEPDDYKISINWRRDEGIWRMLGGPKYFVSEEYEKLWVLDSIKQAKDIRLAICTVAEKKYIGNVYLTDLDFINRKAQSHILIGDRNYWSHGFGREAMMLLLDFAFNERNLHRIEALILEDNIASRRMHERLGFQQEGTLREAVFKDGGYKNYILYSILNQ